MKKASFKTNLAKVKGLGSAKSGAHHWWMERVTSLALIPLSIWFIIIMLQMVTSNAPEFNDIIKSPVNAVTTMMFITIGLYHGMMGMRVIIEDYVHCECVKISLILLTQATGYLTIIAGIWSIFAFHFGIK